MASHRTPKPSTDTPLLWPPLPHPELVTPWWVEEKQEEWGLDSPIYQARVLGQFPEAADDSLISLTWIEAAVAARRGSDGSPRRHGDTERSTEKGKENQDPNSVYFSVSPCLRGEPSLPREAGVDVARYGGCETVVVIRRGPVVERIVAWMGADLMATTGRIVALLREHGPVDAVKVDAIGLGAGVYDRLRELRVPGVVAVNVALPARDRERFENLRDEGFFALRDRFRTGEIALPNDDRLESQLATLRYSYTSRGQLKIEAKDELRARGLPSPDRADALMLAFLPATPVLGPVAAAGPARRGVAGLRA